MPSVSAGTVLTTARTFLNDDVGSVWPDPNLFPKLAQAHREMQAKLKAAAVPVMRTQTDIAVAASTISLALPTDLIEPIRLSEKAQGEAINLFVPMTESDPLPANSQTGILTYWQWTNEAIAFIGATTARTVRLLYWRKLPEPQVNTDPVGFINAELYLAARTAALASQSTGEDERYAMLTAVAEKALDDVIVANRGRARANQSPTKRP